jgi:hypothetical protein
VALLAGSETELGERLSLVLRALGLEPLLAPAGEPGAGGLLELVRQALAAGQALVVVVGAEAQLLIAAGMAYALDPARTVFIKAGGGEGEELAAIDLGVGRDSVVELARRLEWTGCRLDAGAVERAAELLA